MTTHELAAMLDHLRTAFAFGLSKPAVGELEAVGAAFRDGPDQSVKDFLKAIRAARAPAATTKGKSAADVPAVIERVRSVRREELAAEAVSGELGTLNNAQLKQVLLAFDVKATTKIADNMLRAQQLLTPLTLSPVPPKPPAVSPDTALVDRGVETYNRLRDTKGLSIPDLQAEFKPVQTYPKSVVEDIAIRVGYSPERTREETFEMLLTNLERIKRNEYRAEVILNDV